VEVSNQVSQMLQVVRGPDDGTQPLDGKLAFRALDQQERAQRLPEKIDLLKGVLTKLETTVETSRNRRLSCGWYLKEAFCPSVLVVTAVWNFCPQWFLWMTTYKIGDPTLLHPVPEVTIFGALTQTELLIWLGGGLALGCTIRKGRCV
jgi:hypothetical protein